MVTCLCVVYMLWLSTHISLWERKRQPARQKLKVLRNRVLIAKLVFSYILHKHTFSFYNMYHMAIKCTYCVFWQLQEWLGTGWSYRRQETCDTHSLVQNAAFLETITAMPWICKHCHLKKSRCDTSAKERQHNTGVGAPIFHSSTWDK